MAKATLTITIEVTAPASEESMWLVQAGQGNVEQYSGHHAAKDRLLALGLPAGDAVSVLTDALSEALGGSAKPPKRNVSNRPVNPNRVVKDGLGGNQRAVLRTLVSRGTWSSQNPDWKIKSLTPIELSRVMMSLVPHGLVEMDALGIYHPTPKGRDYVSRPEAIVTAISSAPSAS